MSRAKTHVKKGDTVVVITGESKGSQGTVLEVLPAKGRVIVEGVNMIKKAIKPTQQNQNGGFQEKGSHRHLQREENRRSQGEEGQGRREEESRQKSLIPPPVPPEIRTELRTKGKREEHSALSPSSISQEPLPPQCWDPFIHLRGGSLRF